MNFRFSDNQHFVVSGLFSGFVTIFWLALFLYAIHPALPYNPVKLPLSEKLPIKVFMVQGWKFFTRNPREDDLFIYQRDIQSNWVISESKSNGDVQNLFGISRSTRAQGIEIGLLTSKIKKAEWQECKVVAVQCLDSIPSIGVLDNQSLNPTLCGEYAFVLRPPVPWAWRRAKKEVIMPSRVVKAHLLC